MVRRRLLLSLCAATVALLSLSTVAAIRKRLDETRRDARIGAAVRYGCPEVSRRTNPRTRLRSVQLSSTGRSGDAQRNPTELTAMVPGRGRAAAREGHDGRGVLDHAASGMRVSSPPAEPATPPPGTPAVTLRDIASFRPAHPSDGWSRTGGRSRGFRRTSSRTRTPRSYRARCSGSRPRCGSRRSGSGGRTPTARPSRAPRPARTWSALGVAEFTPTDTSHVYVASGEYTVTLRVVLAAEYRFAGRAGCRSPARSRSMPRRSVCSSARSTRVLTGRRLHGISVESRLLTGVSDSTRPSSATAGHCARNGRCPALPRHEPREPHRAVERRRPPAPRALHRARVRANSAANAIGERAARREHTADAPAARAAAGRGRVPRRACRRRARRPST